MLRPLIARREQLDRFVLRRDPRDISRIWALHPETGEYLEVPYRTWSHPAISVWDHSAAVARLREQGRAEIDENALFSMVEQNLCARGDLNPYVRGHQNLNLARLPISPLALDVYDRPNSTGRIGLSQALGRRGVLVGNTTWGYNDSIKVNMRGTHVLQTDSRASPARSNMRRGHVSE